MRTCVQSFRPEGATAKVARGEVFEDDHPVVLANDAMFAPAAAAPDVVQVPGWVAPEPEPEPTPKPVRKKVAS